MKKKLPTKWYKLLKEMDLSEIKDEIVFDDDNCIFETENPLFDIVFDENIVAYGMDEDQNHCTEYGRQLYTLYDLIFFSDAFDIQENKTN